MQQGNNEPVTVTAQTLHGPTFGFGTLGLVAVLSAMVGAVGAGVIAPAVTASMPDLKASQQVEQAMAADSALLVTLGPLTLWAPPATGVAPISTGLSLEGYLQEIEVRAAQLGLVAKRNVTREETRLVIDYAFEDRPSTTGIEPPASKAAQAHPRTVHLTFQAGETPGSLVLTQTRADGSIHTAGQVFVDLVSLGGLKPQLEPGQILTRRGIAEVRTGVTGSQALFLDGRPIYPATVPQAGEPPIILTLDSSLPVTGLFSDDLFLVHGGAGTGACVDKALVVDVVDLRLQLVDQPLVSGALNLEPGRSGVTMGPFCQSVVATSGPEAEQPSAGSLKPVVVREDGSQVVMNARFDLATSAVTWAPTIIPAPEPQAAPGQQPAASANPLAGSAGPWRSTAPNRIASPIIPGGVLVSLTCSASGHAAIAVSGLPAPAGGGDSGSVRFGSAGAASTAAMRWLPDASVYELSARTRPAETAAIIARLAAGGSLSVATGGVSKTTSAPGAPKTRGVVGDCTPQTDASRTPEAAAKPG
jgi:hypothetical protein